ncbi:hypothetical protein GPALN_004492 [Globodera pallida]|nr:hypothetical protein GPALN_004492 [Globodera pallida]
MTEKCGLASCHRYDILGIYPRLYQHNFGMYKRDHTAHKLQFIDIRHFKTNGHLFLSQPMCIRLWVKPMTKRFQNGG